MRCYGSLSFIHVSLFVITVALGTLFFPDSSQLKAVENVSVEGDVNAGI